MSGEGPSRRELLAGAGLLVLGMGLRMAFVLRVPTVAFSDFRALIDFGLEMRRQGWAPGTWHWIQFNPGLAMALSLVFRFFPDPETAARHATAVWTGFMPLLPFLLWRPFLSLRWRFLAGLLLALWPGQIFFSGVVAQENWALVPTVALAALAVRVLRAPESAARPVAAGVLLAACAAFRQELLVALLPAAIAAAGLLRRDGARLRRAAGLAAAAAVPLLALAFQRYQASGRFAITTEHGGLALLGSVVPGAADAGWVDPRAYMAAVEPELLENRTVARKAAARLAAAEWRRRPAFHLLRSASVSGRLAVESDADSLFWSIGSPQALPAGRVDGAGGALYARWFPRLRWELALIQGLFLASVWQALRRRDAAVLVLAACVVLKFALQSVASPLGRLMIPATALELLAIGLGLSELSKQTHGARMRFGLAAAAIAALLLFVEPRLTALAIARDEPPRPVSRFPVEISGSADGGIARCVVEEGEVTSIEWRRAWVRPRSADQPARIRCAAKDVGAAGALIVRIEEPAGTVREAVLGEEPITLSEAGGVSFWRTTPATRTTPSTPPH
ncbi:MAG: hypothetical protein ABW056_07030 [Thermoanaerobaculia bacterium]